MEGTTASPTPAGNQLITEDLDQGVIIHFCPSFLSADEATALFEHIMAVVSWEQSERTLPDGSKARLPRLQVRHCPTHNLTGAQ